VSDAELVETPPESGNSEVLATLEPAQSQPLARKRYQRLTAREIIEVIDLHARGVHYSEVERITGLTHQRQYELLAEYEPTGELAKLKLAAKSKEAADLWTDVAMQKAARRGDSLPAERLLKAVGVIAPDQATSVTVNVGLGVQVSASPFPEAKVPSITIVGRPTLPQVSEP